MVSVKGRSDSLIPSLTQLGLAESPVRVRLDYEHRDITVDAWGNGVPETQQMNGSASIQMTLVHFDQVFLRECVRLSMGAPLAEGQFGRAGQRMGNNLPRFAPAGTVDNNGVAQPGNNYIGLNILSPVQGVPWRFWYTYLMSPPYEWPLGAEKSRVTLNWRAIVYTNDPWGGGTAQPTTVAGTGAQNSILYDHTLDT